METPEFSWKSDMLSICVKPNLWALYMQSVTEPCICWSHAHVRFTFCVYLQTEPMKPGTSSTVASFAHASLCIMTAYRQWLVSMLVCSCRYCWGVLMCRTCPHLSFASEWWRQPWPGVRPRSQITEGEGTMRTLSTASARDELCPVSTTGGHKH